MKESNFSSRLSMFRQNKNMTQEELAERMGVTPQALSKWERGHSLPDILLLKELCRILEISADDLLGIENRKITENGNDLAQKEIWHKLQNCLEPLECIFGKDLVPAFLDGTYQEKIVEARKKLAGEGILMPLVRIRDDEGLASREFAILSYRQTLRKESVETEIKDASYIVGRLEKTVRENYAHILNRDLVKDMVENLQKKYPALIRGVVPERISYGYLTDVFKQLLERGLAPWYFSKIIEIMDSECRRNPSITEEELVCTIGKKLQEK